MAVRKVAKSRRGGKRLKRRDTLQRKTGAKIMGMMSAMMLSGAEGGIVASFGRWGVRMIDLRQINKMMDGRQFIGGDIGLQNIFEHLIREIRGLRREGDSFTEPDIALPFAWRRAYAIWLQLRARENEPDPAAVEDANRSAAMERSWQQFVQDHLQLCDWKSRGHITQDAYEYLNLEPGDLGPLVDPSLRQFDGRRARWGEVAARCRSAVVAWTNMGAEERRQIPHHMYLVRLERSLEKAFAELDRRVSALEAYGSITGTLSSAGALNGHNRSTTEGKQT
jgi:hypothetical protein